MPSSTFRVQEVVTLELLLLTFSTTHRSAVAENEKGIKHLAARSDDGDIDSETTRERLRALRNRSLSAARFEERADLLARPGVQIMHPKN